MHLNWNHPIGKVLASSVAAVFATTSLYAIPKGPCDTKPDVCCEEPKPGPFAFAYPLDMNITCPRDFYIHVDGLAFQAKQDGMEFAIANTNFNPTPGAGQTGITNGEVIGFSNNHHDWDYNPGMRVGLGFYLDHDAWNVDFCWTWLNITNYHNETVPSGSTVLIPEFLVPQSTNGAMTATNTSAAGSWKASYNVLDAKLAKPYYVSRYFIASPHFGVRAGWISQHFSVDYGGVFGDQIRAIQHTDNDMWSFGARTGLNTDWVIGKGWSLFGNAAASLLFAKFQIEQELDYGTAPGDGFSFDDDFYQNIANVEIALGISWGQHFDKNKYRVGLRAAYEFHEWFDINNIRKVFGPGPYYANDRVARGNLTLNGFSLSLSLDM